MEELQEFARVEMLNHEVDLTITRIVPATRLIYLINIKQLSNLLVSFFNAMVVKLIINVDTYTTNTVIW